MHAPWHIKVLVRLFHSSFCWKPFIYISRYPDGHYDILFSFVWKRTLCWCHYITESSLKSKNSKTMWALPCILLCRMWFSYHYNIVGICGGSTHGTLLCVKDLVKVVLFPMQMKVSFRISREEITHVFEVTAGSIWKCFQ